MLFSAHGLTLNELRELAPSGRTEEVSLEADDALAAGPAAHAVAGFGAYGCS